MSAVGRTATAGWEAGVRRTFPVAADVAWDLLVSPEGQALWLGGSVALERGASYALDDGTTGEVRAASDRHVRLTWAPPGWAGESTVQLRVTAVASGSTVALHHERLADADERERSLAHWRGVLDALATRLGDPAPAAGSGAP